MNHYFSYPLFIFSSLVVSTVSIAQNNSVKINTSGSTIQIGDQVWQRKNLSSRVFQNGDTIPLANSKKEWENATTPLCCYLQGDSTLNEDLGLLYNWYAVADPREIKPFHTIS